MSKSLLVSAQSRMKQTFSWRRILSAAVLLFSLSFLGYTVYTSWDALKTYNWQIQVGYLLPSFLLFLVQLVIVVRGWQSIMDCLAQPLPFRDHLKIYALTILMRRIPAGTLWLVAGRAYAYRDQSISAWAPTIASFLELLLVIFTGLPLAALAGAGLNLLSPKVAVVLAAIALVLEICAVHPAVLSKLYHLVRRQTLPVELSWRKTLYWALIYNLVWLVSGIGLFLIARLFTDVPIGQLPLIIGVWVLSSLIAYLMSFSPSGLGVKELSLVYLLGIPLPEPFPLLIALAVRLIWTIYDIIIGLVAWLAH